MNNGVVVAFSEVARHEFRITDAELSGASVKQAQTWLDEQWVALECEPVRPSGKVLLFDKILGIARQAGERRFAEDTTWARAFARNVAMLVERPVVVVDVAGNRVG